MSVSVFTGWRTLTPGTCEICGFDDDWEVDGRGAIFCGCQRCPDCLEEPGWHSGRCGEVLQEPAEFDG